MLGHVAQHGTQVLHIDEQQPLVVCNPEDDVHHAGLHFVEPEQAAEKHRTHVGNGGTHRMTLLAEHVEEAGRAACELRILDAELGQALLDEAAEAAGLADAGEVALHVSHEAGDTHLAEGLRKDLEGDGLAGAGRTGDEAVAVRHLADNGNRSLGTMGYIQPVGFVVHIWSSFSFFYRVKLIIITEFFIN